MKFRLKFRYQVSLSETCSRQSLFHPRQLSDVEVGTQGGRMEQVLRERDRRDQMPSGPGSCCICSETYQALLSPSSPLLLKPGKHEFRLLASHGILMGQNRSGKFLGFKMLCAWYNCFSALLAPLPMPNHELPMDGVITLLDGNQVTSCV